MSFACGSVNHADVELDCAAATMATFGGPPARAIEGAEAAQIAARPRERMPEGRTLGDMPGSLEEDGNSTPEVPRTASIVLPDAAKGVADPGARDGERCLACTPRSSPKSR